MEELCSSEMSEIFRDTTRCQNPNRGLKCYRYCHAVHFVCHPVILVCECRWTRIHVQSSAELARITFHHCCTLNTAREVHWALAKMVALHVLKECEGKFNAVCVLWLWTFCLAYGSPETVRTTKNNWIHKEKRRVNIREVKEEWMNWSKIEERDC